MLLNFKFVLEKLFLKIEYFEQCRKNENKLKEWNNEFSHQLNMAINI